MRIAASNRRLNLLITAITNRKIQLMHYAGIAISVTALAGCIAVAPRDVATRPEVVPIAAKTINKAALSGTVQRFTNYFYLNPDCTTEGVPSVRVVEAPVHGKITLEEGLGYPSFSRDNQRYECNKHKSQMIKVMYQSDVGYVGPDAVKLEVIFVNGNFLSDSFNIFVK